MAFIEHSPREVGFTVDYDNWSDKAFVKDNVFVHYNGPSVSDYIGGVAREMGYLRAVERHHLGKGWRGFAYGWAVGASGHAYRGRGWNRYGAHRGDYDMDGILENDEGIPILLILGEGQSPTPAMVATLAELVAELEQDNRSDHDLLVLGHKDVGATQCPGTLVYELIQGGLPTPPVGGTDVISHPRAAQRKASAWAIENKTRKASVYADGVIREIVAAYWKWGEIYGVDPALAIAQSAKETGFWSYGGDVKATQWNFAGIGATGGVSGVTYPSIDAGVRAHMLRMRMYAVYDAGIYDASVLGRALPSSHWGKYPTIEQFNGVWAVPGVGYGQSVVENYLVPLRNTEVDVPVPLTLEQRVQRLERLAGL